MLSLTRTLLTIMDEPLFPCNKPCRFLFEEISESAVTGLPIGVRQKCLFQEAQATALRDALKKNDTLSVRFTQFVSATYNAAINRAVFTRVEIERQESLIASVRAEIDQLHKYLQGRLDALHMESVKGILRRDNDKG